MSPTVAAVILAGGRGERLGGAIKANVRVGGKRLLERVGEALGERPDVVLVSIGGFAADAIPLSGGQVAIADLASDYGGPLAGVAAAVNWCNDAGIQPELLISAAVDTPFLPPDFVDRMLAALGPDAAAIVASYGGQDYPTNAIWRLAAIARLPQQLAGGAAPHSLRRLALGLGAQLFEWPGTASGDPFASVNTPADLAALEARAAPGN